MKIRRFNYFVSSITDYGVVKFKQSNYGALRIFHGWLATLVILACGPVTCYPSEAAL